MAQRCSASRETRSDRRALKFFLILTLSISWLCAPLAIQADEGRSLLLNGRTGWGAQRSLSQLEGLSIQRGFGQFLIGEFTLGLSHRYEQAQNAFLLNMSAGLHLQLRQAGDVALFTVGLRYGTAIGDPCMLTARCEGELLNDAQAQFIELPFRIYWFPNRFISLHAEFGALLRLGGRERSFYQLPSEDGSQLDIFRGGPLAGLGLSLWL